MLEERLAGEMLIVGVLDPAGDDRLIRQPPGVLQIEQPSHQPRFRRRPPLAGRRKPRPLAVKHLPIDQGRQLHQLVPRVDHVDQPRTQQIILLRRARATFHGQDKIAAFRRKSYETLQGVARKTTTFQHKINGMGVVQGELFSSS